MKTLRIPTISGMKEDQVNGLLLSFLSSVTEVTIGRKQTSYLSHFYRERLNKFEKKRLILLLETLKSQLSEGKGENSEIRSSVHPDLEVSKVFSDFFQLFKNLGK
jgi:predicted membrane metal-binding protein